jgi:hypothetical protein
MGVQGRDILLLVKSDATNPQDTLFLRTIEVDSIIEEESDAFCEDWIWPSAKDISLSSYIYIESKLTMCSDDYESSGEEEERNECDSEPVLSFTKARAVYITVR